jgi:von Willebrand factor type A domain
MGSVEFDHLVAELTPRGAYDVVKQNAIKNDAAGLTPRGATSIGGGLQRGQTQVGGSAIARKIILVFTDGIQNTPPDIATVRPAIINAGIEVYAIGLGLPQDISAPALSSLAISSNGRFFLTDDGLILRKDFVQVLADAFRQQMAADPVGTIAQGEVLESKVWITDCERRISFVLNWEDTSTQLGFELEAPDGTIFTPAAPATNKLVRYGQQPGYRWYNVAFPPLQPGTGHVGPQRAGQWILRATGLQVSGRKRYSTSVIVESDLTMQLDVKGGDPRKPIQISVLLEHERDEISDADVSLRLTSPTRTIQQVVGRAAIERVLREETSFLDIGTLFHTAARLLATSRGRRGRLIPLKKKTFELKGRRGRFSFALPPPLTPGVYDYELEIVGHACGGTFQRYASGSIAIENPVSPGQVGITVSPTGTVGTSTIGTVTITPVTVTGANLGPGYGATISGSVARGTVNAVVDNLDGTYTFHLTWQKSRRPPTLEVSIGEAVVKVPLRATRRTRTARQSRSRSRKR